VRRSSLLTKEVEVPLKMLIEKVNLAGRNCLSILKSRRSYFTELGLKDLDQSIKGEMKEGLGFDTKVRVRSVRWRNEYKKKKSASIGGGS
jgi:hypothetical protein